MDCALWLNRRKIFTAAEISGNLDLASLRGYFLAGTLIDWLNEHGGKRYADKLSMLSPDDSSLNEKLAEIFGATPLPFKELDGQTAPQAPDISVSALLSSYPIGSAGSYNYEAISSFGSFQNMLTSYSTTSFLSGSGSFLSWEQWLGALFGYGSFSSGSFSLGSYSQWEWLYNLLFGYGSFSYGSFSLGSYSQWEWLYNLLFGYGSFSHGSFSLGSYSQWEWLYNLLFGYGSFSAENLGSFSIESLLSLFRGYGSFTFGSFGSYERSEQNEKFFIDEYDFIMLKTLADNPLDRYGYGIHNI